MKFDVFLTLRAEFDAEEAYLYIRRSAPRAAIRWFNGLTKAIQSLENTPDAADWPRKVKSSP